MTDAERILAVKVQVNDETLGDDLVSVYLTLAEGRIVRKEYPFGDGTETMSTKYEPELIELAARMIMRRGFEGQTNSNENGIIRQWETVNDEDVLNRVTQKVGFPQTTGA